MIAAKKYDNKRLRKTIDDMLDKQYYFYLRHKHMAKKLLLYAIFYP